MELDARRSGLSFLGGVGVGAALMYFGDGSRGRRRRNLVRDQVVHLSHAAANAMDATSRDVGNRARGVAATARSRMNGDQPDDQVLAARVRSKLGRVVSHPRAILVAANDGHVSVAGPILQNEVRPLMRCVRKVRGVRSVENRLEVHDSAGDVPGLQGGRQRDRTRSEFAQGNWTPASRLVAAAAGTALLAYATRRRDALGILAAAAGAALSTRGLTNFGAQQLTGVGAGRRLFDIHKTVTINAPKPWVFDTFQAFEQWPRWMSHVREVTRNGTVGGAERTHWVVDGPAGVPISWDAITTRFIHGERIEWRSVEGSPVRHEGSMTFRETDDGATIVDLQMSYNPPAGALGHAVASFFGKDPKRQLDDDLARIKTTIETGRPPHDAAGQRHQNNGGSRVSAELTTQQQDQL